MKTTEFSIYRDYEIKCKLFEHDGDVKNIIIGVHGFAGDKDSSMLKRLAKGCKDSALLCFDFPSHGKSPVGEDFLTVKNCKADLLAVCEYARENFPDAKKALFATSFGGYVSLLCSDELSDFSFVLRAPAITMPDILLDNVLKISKKDFENQGSVLCGFERKLSLPFTFYSDMTKEPDLLSKKINRSMLIIHGDCDDIVPPSVIYEFAKKNTGTILNIIEGADHRFKNAGEIDLVIKYTAEYLGLF